MGDKSLFFKLGWFFFFTGLISFLVGFWLGKGQTPKGEAKLSDLAQLVAVMGGSGFRLDFMPVADQWTNTEPFIQALNHIKTRPKKIRKKIESPIGEIKQ